MQQRSYVPSEITWLLKTLNFQTIEIFGAKFGAFSRNDKLTTEDFEMLVIAEKDWRGKCQQFRHGKST